MTTLLQLRSIFKGLMGMRVTTATTDDAGGPSNAYIDTMLDIARKSDYLKLAASAAGDKLTKNVTLTYTASAESVDLSTLSGASVALRRPIKSISLLPAASASTPLSRYPLLPKTFGELDEFMAYGEPEVYFYEVNTGLLHLRPVPQTAPTIYVRYIPGLTTLTDSAQPTEFLDFQELVAFRAVANYKRSVNDDDWQVQDAQADTMFEDVKTMYMSMHDDTHIQHKPRGGW